MKKILKNIAKNTGVPLKLEQEEKKTMQKWIPGKKKSN